MVRVKSRHDHCLRDLSSVVLNSTPLPFVLDQLISFHLRFLTILSILDLKCFFAEHCCKALSTTQEMGSEYFAFKDFDFFFFFWLRDDIRKIMLSKYMSNPDYNFEKVNRASVACGPLVKWAVAQVN